MTSLQEIAAEEFVNSYPLDILELIAEKANHRIKLENRRQVVIKFNLIHINLQHIISCIIDMDLLTIFIRDYSTYNILINDLNRIIDYEQIKTATYDQLIRIYSILRGYLADNSFIMNNEENEKIISYLQQYPEYQIYFTRVNYHKNDYVLIFNNRNHQIIDDVNKLDFWSPKCLLTLYRVL